MSIAPDQRATKIITAEVVAVVTEFEQTIVEDNTGWQYAIVRTTRGINWDTLKVGQTVELEVYVALPIVKEVLDVY
jgi:hypothetical protein